MGKWSDVDESRIWRALVVQEFGDVDALAYLQTRSRVDDGRSANGQTVTGPEVVDR